MIICWHCTTILLDGTIFCDTCGAALLPGAPHRVEAPLAPAAGEEASPCAEARLVLAETGEAIALPATAQVVVGRQGDAGPAPDIDLAPFEAAAAGVSRVHAALDLGGPRPLIEDLGSTNGTYVNGRRLAPRSPVALRAGDRISLGQLAVRIELPH